MRISFLLLQQGTIYVERQSGKVTNDFWDVRTVSALALGEIGNPKALPALYQAVRYEPDNYVRSAISMQCTSYVDQHVIL